MGGPFPLGHGEGGRMTFRFQKGHQFSPLRLMHNILQDCAKGEDSSIMEKIMICGFVYHI